VDYPNKKRCCGGPVLAVDEKTSLAIAKEKLDDIRMPSQCHQPGLPLLLFMYDSNQKASRQLQRHLQYPCSLPHPLLGIAMGFDRGTCLNMNVVKPKTRWASMRAGISD